MNILHLKEGMRLYKRAKYVRKHGLHRYEGSAKEICYKIIDDCWNGEYLRIATDYGHYRVFYLRDFGWSVESLLKLGYRDKVIKSLDYALNIYSKDRLTTTINPEGQCVDLFMYSPDSIAYMIHSLRLAKADELIKKYKEFLQKEVNKCFEMCFDTDISLMRKDKHYGSIKDSTFRYSSTYDNTMMAMLSNDLDAIGLKNPYKPYNIKKAMKENLWNKEKGYWYDDLQQKDVVTGDSNTFPYWTRVFTDKEMIESSIKNIQKAGLDDPFPIKYSNQKMSKESFWRSLIVSDYQTHSIKTHMGALYIHVVKSVNKELAEKYRKKYKENIERDGTYLENYTAEGKPLNTKFYFSDEGNLWAANFITLDE